MVQQVALIMVRASMFRNKTFGAMGARANGEGNQPVSGRGDRERCMPPGPLFDLGRLSATRSSPHPLGAPLISKVPLPGRSNHFPGEICYNHGSTPWNVSGESCDPYPVWISLLGSSVKKFKGSMSRVAHRQQFDPTRAYIVPSLHGGE